MDLAEKEAIRQRVIRFLYREAELLDDFRLEEWLELLADDVTYKVPIRLTRERSSSRSEFSDDSYHFNDTYGTMATRVRRFESEFAWSESPRSRTRRFVGNVRVESVDDDLVTVKSNLQIQRRRGQSTDTDTITGERRDVLRMDDDEMELVERVAKLDHTIIPSQNFSIFV